MKIRRKRIWSDDLRLITMRSNTFGKKFWKLNAESKFIVDILEALPFIKVVNFNKLSHFFFLTDRPSLAKYQRKKLSETLPFIFQVEDFMPGSFDKHSWFLTYVLKALLSPYIDTSIAHVS